MEERREFNTGGDRSDVPQEDRNARVQVKVADRSVPLEWSGDILLPDYRSEISRLLWVRPGFSMPTVYFGNGRAELSGNVLLEALYVGPDGSLYGVSEVREYSFSQPLDLPEADHAEVTLTAELLPDAVISRVSAPRKLSIRARLHAKLQGFANRSLLPRTGGKEDEILTLCESVEVCELAHGVSESLELQEEVQPGGEGELRVIATWGSVFLPEVHAQHGNVRARGEAVLTLLCCRETAENGEGVPFTLPCRIPFEEEIPMENATTDCAARAVGTVEEIGAAVEDGRILLNVRIALAAETAENRPAYYVKDLFLPGKETTCRCATQRLARTGLCGNRHFSVGENLTFAACGIPAGATLIDCYADTEADPPVLEKDRTVLTGNMRCRILYLAAGEYGVAEVTVPFRHLLEERFDAAEVLCPPPLCRVSGDRDHLRVDAELQLSLRTDLVEEITAVTEAAFASAVDTARGDVEICYPAKGESLWDVCRRLGLSPHTVAAANGLSADAPGTPFSGVRYLIIPQK